MGIQWMVGWTGGCWLSFAICYTTRSHNGHAVDGGLDWWVLMPFAPSVVPSLDRLARAPVQGAPLLNTDFCCS